MATTAAMESSSAQRSTLASTGASKENPKPRNRPRVSRKIVWTANQIARFQHDADDGCGDCGQGTVQGLVST
jgi:hypothetical protein